MDSPTRALALALERGTPKKICKSWIVGTKFSTLFTNQFINYKKLQKWEIKQMAYWHC
ncbi:hypothetical protein B0I22_0739 [Epilithonimonas xixisoli]|uniref:Uncharacterized protein n=1 Tax=Epilithonimonas xixisoli TaxID=1476462 RepID=A0A4R8II72_9FLAO|nr:hypothetical protein B0I22_0739 [Epilithonimonas xixisoli]